MIDARKGWTEGECTTTRFFDGIDRWRTANPPPGPRVRAAARLQLGHFKRPHQARWWAALALTMLLAVIAAALTIVALDDVLMVLLVAITLMLVGIFVYVVYALALATRSRAYPVTRWRHRCRVMWLTDGTSTVGAALTIYVRRGGAVTFHNHFRWPAITPQRPPVARQLRLELLTMPCMEVRAIDRGRGGRTTQSAGRNEYGHQSCVKVVTDPLEHLQKVEAPNVWSPSDRFEIAVLFDDPWVRAVIATSERPD